MVSYIHVYLLCFHNIYSKEIHTFIQEVLHVSNVTVKISIMS